MKRNHLTQLLVILVLLLSVVLIGSAAAQPTEGQLVRGDVNGDGAINMKDVLLLRKYLADMDVTIADHVCTAAPSESGSETQATESSATQATESSATQATESSATQATESSATQATESSATQATESSATQATESSATQATESSATQATESSATQATETSATQTSATQATQTSATQTSATQPTQATETSATQATGTTQSQPVGDTVALSLSVEEESPRYTKSTRTDSFQVPKNQEATLVITLPGYYKGNTEEMTKLLERVTLTANGTALTPTVTFGDMVSQKCDVYYTFKINVGTTAVTVAGTVSHPNFEQFGATVNGNGGSGGATTTTQANGAVTDPDYPAAPDMVTLAFNDPETCQQYGILWHTYKDVTSPMIQYVEGSVTDTTAFAASATNITAITKTSASAIVKSTYDPLNNWAIGSGSSVDVTQYTYRGVLPTTLKASTTYSYRVGDATTGAWSAIYTFTTRPATVGNNFSFIFLNDTQFTESDETGPVTFKSILNAAVSTCQADFSALPQLVLHGGDLISENSHTYNYGNVFGSNGDFFGRYPMFATLGNHDAEKKYFFDNWNVTNTTGKGYYSFNYGTMHVTVLDNSSEGLKRLTTDQINFLKSDMQANASAEWKIVMLHRPIYGALTYNQNGWKEGQEYWEYGKPSLRYRMTNVCNDYDVDYVFQAHCHQYMRSYPITGYTKTDLADDSAISAWDDTNDSTYVQMNSSPAMSMENGTNYYVNPNGTVYGTFSTAGTDPDPVFAESTHNKDGYAENKWVAYATTGKKYSFSAVNINGGYLTIDHCYLDGTTVKHYENSRGYGIKKTS